MKSYFDQFNKKYLPDNIEVLEQYALDNHVPIIMKDSLMVILNLLSFIKPTRILEIGTAIGYSSICMAYSTNAIIDTIERDDKMYQLALNNIKNYKLENKINVFFDDALQIDLSLLNNYDVIFIDAAKAQNIKFFEKFSPLLRENGIIITDNLYFHGTITDLDNVSKNVRKMVEKIDVYNHYLAELKDFKTIFLPIGDGISITRRVNHEVNG